MLRLAAAALASLGSSLAVSPAVFPSGASSSLDGLTAWSLDGYTTIFKKAGQLREDRKFKEAIAEFEKITKASDAPKDLRAQSQYNIGCCYALLKDKKQATDAVVKSLELGFTNVSLLNEDPDIESIRKDPRIADALKRLRSAEDERAIKDAEEKVKGFRSFPFAFDLKTLDGKSISSKDLLGKVAIVDVWGTWCPPCRMEIPSFIEIVNRHKNDPFVMVGLNDEQTEDRAQAVSLAQEFASANKINYTLAIIDDKTERQIPGFGAFPTTLFFDRTGKVRYMHVGLADLSDIEGVVLMLLREGEAKKDDAPKTPDAPKPADAPKPKPSEKPKG